MVKQAESTFKNGKKWAYWQWFENGNLEAKSIFLNDMPDGLLKQWYSNGQISAEVQLHEDL